MLIYAGWGSATLSCAATCHTRAVQCARSTSERRSATRVRGGSRTVCTIRYLRRTELHRDPPPRRLLLCIVPRLVRRAQATNLDALHKRVRFANAFDVARRLVGNAFAGWKPVRMLRGKRTGMRLTSKRGHTKPSVQKASSGACWQGTKERLACSETRLVHPRNASRQHALFPWNSMQSSIRYQGRAHT